MSDDATRGSWACGSNRNGQSGQSADLVVTGGGTGLGLVTATALADNGCKVYITGRRAEPLKAAEREASKSGAAIIAVQADVSTKEGISSESE